MNVNFIGKTVCAAALIASTVFALNVNAAPLEPVMSLATKEKQPLLDTLKDLVSIESGSGDREGLDKISELIARRLRELGGTVEFIEPASADIYRMVDT
ncbi:MAG TPA: M20 family peptidase, partial [Burkholderiales bacterium]|nr:M20 family peptidase [Burkholderiales bacterium]